MPDKTLDVLLRYYRDQVVGDVALAYSVAEKIPPSILNEIRNALGHMARLPDLAPASDDFAAQWRAAEGHLLRVRLDCAKLCLIAESEKLDDDLEILTLNTTVPASLLDRAEAIRQRRRDLQQREAGPPTDDLVDQFLDLFAECDAFRRYLRAEYSDLVVEGWRLKREADMNAADKAGYRRGRRDTFWAAATLGLATSIGAGLLLGLIGF